MEHINFDLRTRCKYPYHSGDKVSYLLDNLNDERTGIIRIIRDNYVTMINGDIVSKALIFHLHEDKENENTFTESYMHKITSSNDEQGEG